MDILRKHTSWQKIEDLDAAVTKASNYWNEIHAGTSTLDIHNLQNELGIIKALYSDLTEYSSQCTKSLEEAVQNTKLEEELAINKTKVIDAANRRTTANSVRKRVWNLRNSLEVALKNCKRHKEYDKETRERIREGEEAKRLIKEKWECLCNLMKEVLGDRVENVHISILSDSPCMLKDSGMGGKTIEINPHDLVINDLLKRVDADRNDSHVRDATLSLFSHAEFLWKFRREQPVAQTLHGYF